jgi:hypothetical protein
MNTTTKVIIAVLVVAVIIAAMYYWFVSSRPAEIDVVADQLLFDGASYATLGKGQLVNGARRYAITFDLTIKPDTNGLALMYGEPATTKMPHRGYVAVWIDNTPQGNLVVIVNRSIGQLTLRFNGKANDGKTRAIRFERDGAKWTLTVDGAVAQTTTDTVDTEAIPPSGMYVGGANISQGAVWTITGITGCIGALKFNGDALRTFAINGKVATKCT